MRGIDLLYERLPNFNTRLPRMRGDRPWLALIVASSLSVYPACAGSTGYRVLLGYRVLVYPACGIDRRFACHNVTVKRLLPHARDRTAMTWMTDLIGQVYPACVGIDLAQKGCAPM